MQLVASDDVVREAHEWRSPYEQWKESEGLATIRGLSVDLADVELRPWKSRGGSGVFINLDSTQGFNDTYVSEIPARQSLAPIRHIYEETVYILHGQGTTTVWIDEHKKQTFEWHARTPAFTRSSKPSSRSRAWSAAWTSSTS